MTNLPTIGLLSQSEEPAVLRHRTLLSLLVFAVLLTACGYEGQPHLPAADEVCNNGWDDDYNGAEDCEDSVCVGTPACTERCNDGRDNDLDGLVDCQDPDCSDHWDCDESCTNGVDDDADGAIDCDDTECSSRPPCVEDCTEDGDADSDALLGCEDPDCWDAPQCPEWCQNGVDDDFDGAVDCADEECWCRPEDDEFTCSDGRDNDLDGALDCDEPDCDGTDFCSCAGEFRGGVCLTEPARELEGWPLSYISAFGVPPWMSDAECCFDVDGDGVADNGYATFFEIAPGRDAENNFQAALDRGESQTLIAWDPAGEVLHLLDVTNDVEGDGIADQDYAERDAGRGVFRLLDQGADAYGPLSQFNVREEADTYSAGGTGIRLRIPFPFLDGLVEFQLRNARIYAPFREDDAGRWSTETTWQIETPRRPEAEQVAYGDIELSGVIMLDEIVAAVEAAYRDCECAGFDPDQLLLVGEEWAERFVIGCLQWQEGVCNAGDICDQAGMMCAWMPSLSDMYPVDTDGNGIGDALSIGLRLSVAPATLVE